MEIMAVHVEMTNLHERMLPDPRFDPATVCILSQFKTEMGTPTQRLQVKNGY